MTDHLSVFHSIAHDEQGDSIRARKTAVACKQRLDDRYAKWLAQPGFDERWAYVEDEARDIVLATADEFGHTGDPDHILSAYRSSVRPAEMQKEAAVHEARLPRMCPFHKDVVDISLAAGDARAGFDSMAQHWGGPRHCEGDGYKGESCKFKAPMATQSYWDERKERADQKREERELRQQEQAELEAQQPEVPEVEEPINQVTDLGEPETEGPVNDPAPEPAAEEIPMAMAASTKTADGGPVPTMDKRKWTPQTVKRLDVDDSDGRNPTKHKDILEPIVRRNADDLDEIGEGMTERQDVEKDSNPTDGGGSGQSDLGGRTGPATAVAGFLSNQEVQAAIVKHQR